MDLSLPEIMREYRLSIRGVIHVGAHLGQEAGVYRECGIGRQLWIEPQPDIFARLCASLPESLLVKAVNVACGEAPGVATMHVLSGNEGKSNSLLEPKLHLQKWPEFQPGAKIDVAVKRLDDVIEEQGLRGEDFNLICIDTQGFELPVLRGATRQLTKVDALVCEVSAVELYKGGTLVRDLDAFLCERGFLRVKTKWASGCSGDALYVRRGLLSPFTRAKITLLGGQGHVPSRRAMREMRAKTGTHTGGQGHS
ncbi:MAG: FkbM family methyltransferase [Phycisphaerales bacterium]|nr:FkbM family methyltransferase [Phycisphaerales bacterium]